MAETPIITMDEAGHTGENLRDSDQPVYALAAVAIETAAAVPAVQAALARTQGMDELKFSRLRRSSAGRKNILSLLEELDLDSKGCAVIVVHKPWMVAAKMIDELVEPRMLKKGLQSAWYASGSAKNMVNAFYELAPRALGEMYDELVTDFIAMVREHSPEKRDAYLSSLRRSKIVCRDDQVLDLLSVMIEVPEDVDTEFNSRQDALDPALAALFWHGGYWSAELETRFQILHDDSNDVRRWQETVFEGIQQNMADRSASESFSLGKITIRLPTLLDTIDFASSHADERVQVADVLAGSAAHLYAVMADLRRDEGNFAKQLHQAGVADLIKEAVGPDPV